MRIIGGIAGGTNIDVPEGLGVRPTESRVRESLFDSLGDLRGKTILDMFSGSGSLGLEALSRGAASVTFLEKNPKHVKYIEANLARVRKVLGDSCGKAEIITGDASKAPQLLSSMKCRFDFILADPPYVEDKQNPYGAPSLAMDEAFADFAGNDAILVLEHSSDTLIAEYPYSKWEIFKHREYGIRCLSYMRLV